MNDEIALVFRDVADLSPTERELYFQQRRIPTVLRAEVESLLVFDSGSGGRSPTAVLGGAAADILESADAIRVGQRHGPYRLIRLLGRGGAGTVFLAERTDGEVEHHVAIKFLRQGSEGPVFRERFLRERQILASLHHAGIARLLDAGQTADGQPYLVMDYIEGTTIDAYVAPLDIRAKLDLFLRVANAVSYAHRNLVIHRDIKPSNILVDGAGEPKLLDFGIAKILDDATGQTRTQDRALTPDFASPEQVRGAVQTTAIDVYGLGAVLYKLLTGRSPHVFEEARPGAIEHAICSVDPPAPSSLNRDLPHDLDFILAKALRKEPEERYASVDAFADDIRSFLQWRPVRARSGNAWYRARKYARRYWLPVTAGALAAAGLSIGLFVANRERIIAQRRFSELHQLSAKVFDLDADLRKLPGSTEARQRLVSTSLEYLERLGTDARRDLDLAREIAASYERVAQIQGVPTWNNLGQFAQADENLKKAEVIIESLLASRPRNGDALYTAAMIHRDRMILANSEHRNADALMHAVEAARRLETFMKLGDRTQEQRAEAAGIYSNIALAHLNMHRYEDAVRYSRQASELTRPIPSAQDVLGGALSVLATALRSQGDLEGALHAIREARSVAERTAYSTETQRALNLYGVYLREGRILGEDGGISLDLPQEAAEAFGRAVKITEAAARADPNDQASRSRLGLCARSLADILRHRDPRHALEFYDLAVRRLGEIQGNVTARRDRAVALANSSYALLQLHRTEEARQRIDAAFSILRDTKDYPADRIGLESEAMAALRALADFRADQRDLGGAIATYEQAMEKAMASKPDPSGDLRDASKLSELYVSLAGLYRRTGDVAKARVLQLRRTELWSQWDRKLPANSFVRRQLALRVD